ncbi:oncostatin-M-specific receptor subunit beta isoform X3 [Alosa sapidissima]|uniref:oncostatin-M-specific receptor subunit beta isoform X3 n=1 Tax=Alosa sapidissima TaxID=34773 RepID=UPI001C07FC83|nr:oncostatin-M-specific receptor subunit beta isoform X3 [Alosa sapidissima]
MDQALWCTCLILAIICNGWCKGFDFMDFTPIKFKLYPQDHQHIVVNWTVDSALENVTYEIQVARTENFNLIESVNISTKSQNSEEPFQTWTWTSKLPLQCTDHSVRMRLIYNYNSTFVDSWSQWKTHTGKKINVINCYHVNESVIVTDECLAHDYIRFLLTRFSPESSPRLSPRCFLGGGFCPCVVRFFFSSDEGAHDVWDEPQIFPSEEVFQERSEVYFCCVAPRDAQVTSITFNRTRYPLISISSQVKAIAVDNLNITSELGVSLVCLDSKGDEGITSNFVTFPPQKPRNVSCETEDLKVWSCRWDPGRPPNLHKRHVHHYALLVDFLAVSHLSEYYVTVVVTSSLGQEMESIKFHALDRVFPVAKSLSVIPDVHQANVSWTIEGNFTKIPMICQVQIIPEGNVLTIEQTGGLALHFSCQLENLKPSTQYSVKVQCAVSGRRWRKWAGPLFFNTHPLVLLDIWRSIQALPSGRRVILTWRTYTSDMQLDVKSYEIRLQQENSLGTLWTNTTSVNPQVNQTEFFIDEQGCNISVYANITAGISVASHIFIPPAKHSENAVIPKRVVGSVRTGFMLSWTEDPSAVCGYTVEWCHNGSGVLPCTPSNLQWQTVRRSNTSLSLKAGSFMGGCRYTFNVLRCREDGHHLIETHIGYLQEQTPTQFVQIQNYPVVTSSSATIEWSFPEDDPRHPGFISGYLVTFQNGHWSDQNHNSYNLSIDNPHRKSITVNSLWESREYSFCVQPCTSAGPGPSTCRTFRTSPDYTHFWVKILIPVIFLFGCCILLWPYWKRLRSTVVEIFTHPTKVNVNVLQLDSSLYETSERIRALTVEDCLCCDLEIIEVKPGVAECKCLVYPNEASCSFAPLTACCCTELTDDVWGDPVSERGVSVCNFTYSPTFTEVSFCRSSFSSDGLTEGQPVQPHDTCTTDYVVSAEDQDATGPIVFST